MYRRRFACGLLVLFIGTISGCSESGESKGAATTRSGPLKATCTTGMIGDAVERVGGEHVKVTTLMGPGVDPHLYKATAGDNARLSEADIVFYNGLMLEGKMTDIFVALARRKPVVPVTASIDRSRLLEPPAFAGHYDPHVWFDVSMWQKVVETISTELATHDPAHADAYRTSSAAYLQELQQLHDWSTSRSRELPPEKRVLITSHDAYNYFGRAYGFEVIGVQGISTEEQATAKSIIDLSEIIIKRKVKAIFTESSVSPKAIRAVIEGCRHKGWEVVEGGSLFSDAMDARGKPAGTYLGMVRHNVNTIVDALK